jgi:hypothetical protein
MRTGLRRPGGPLPAVNPPAAEEEEEIVLERPLPIKEPEDRSTSPLATIRSLLAP